MDGDARTSAEATSEILLEVRPMLIIHKDNNRVERLTGTEIIPPNPTDDVVSNKDVQISSSPDISARLFLPNKYKGTDKKIPLLIYFHGGGFLIETSFSPIYHPYLHTLAAKSSTLILSVNYRLAPEHLLPAAYNDCWTAIQWAISRTTSDPWITQHADLSKLFLAGDSAGGNIVHHMGLRFQKTPPPGPTLRGLVLVQPFFLGETPVPGDVGDVPGMLFVKKVWKVAIGGCEMIAPEGMDHPWINPEKDPEFVGKVGTDRVLVFVAEKDVLRSRGVYYAEELLKKRGGNKSVEVVETMGEDHVFHLFYPETENAAKKMNKFVEFLNS